jgi:glutaredoxin
MRAVIWSKDNCIYCTKAKDYLNKKHVKIEERNVESGNWSMFDLQKSVPGARAFPQIFIDGKYIGSYDKMVSHIALGQLSL